MSASGTPNVILSLFGVATTQEVWIRVLGMALTSQSALYWQFARHPTQSGMNITVIERLFAALVLVVLSILNGPWQLALFAAVELLGSLWTFFEANKTD